MGVVNGKSVKIDAVEILAHGAPDSITLSNDNSITLTTRVVESNRLSSKNIGELIILSCNTAHQGYSSDPTIAEAFASKVGNGVVLASDGTVWHNNTFWTGRHYFYSEGDGTWKSLNRNGEKDAQGFLKIYKVGGTVVKDVIGKSFDDVGDLIDQANDLPKAKYIIS
jgi:hypothetical protein